MTFECYRPDIQDANRPSTVEARDEEEAAEKHSRNVYDAGHDTGDEFEVMVRAKGDTAWTKFEIQVEYDVSFYVTESD